MNSSRARPEFELPSLAKPEQRRDRDADVPIRRNPSMHDAALKAFKRAVLIACHFLVLVRAAAAEEKRPASPTSGQAAGTTTPDRGVREAATRAVQLIDRTSAKFLTTRACFTCHTQT